MRNLKHVVSDIEFYKTMKMLSISYEEISLIRMSQVRKQVISSRVFFSKLMEIFSDLQFSYKSTVSKLFDKKNSASIPLVQRFLNSAGKKSEVAVLLSSNNKLYGELYTSVFSAFSDYLQSHPSAEVVVLGNYGIDLFERSGIQRQSQYYSYSETQFNQQDFEALMSVLKDYSVIEVFYGKFENIISQTPTHSTITANSFKDFYDNSHTVIETKSSRKEYLFEPGLDRILDYFEEQFLAQFLTQSIKESTLSSHASRIQAMETALSTIDKKQRLLTTEQKKIKRMMGNKKQLERFSSHTMWK